MFISRLFSFIVVIIISYVYFTKAATPLRLPTSKVLEKRLKSVGVKYAGAVAHKLEQSGVIIGDVDLGNQLTKAGISDQTLTQSLSEAGINNPTYVAKKLQKSGVVSTSPVMVKKLQQAGIIDPLMAKQVQEKIKKSKSPEKLQQALDVIDGENEPEEEEEVDEEELAIQKKIQACLADSSYELKLKQAGMGDTAKMAKKLQQEGVGADDDHLEEKLDQAGINEYSRIFACMFLSMEQDLEIAGIEDPQTAAKKLAG